MRPEWIEFLLWKRRQRSDSPHTSNHTIFRMLSLEDREYLLRRAFRVSSPPLKISIIPRVARWQWKIKKRLRIGRLANRSELYLTTYASSE